MNRGFFNIPFSNTEQDLEMGNGVWYPQDQQSMNPGTRKLIMETNPLLKSLQLIMQVREMERRMQPKKGVDV